MSTRALNPEPVVTIDGVTVAAGPVAGQVMVVDGLSVTWGKEDPLGQPEPATATITLWDRTRGWALQRELRGVPVQLSYPDPITSLPGRLPHVFFRGRIDAVEVIPHKAGGVRGSLVVLECRSLVGDLAQRMPIGAWPAETIEARRARLEVEVRAAGIVSASLATPKATEVDIRQAWRTTMLAPVAADEQRSVYEHLLALYDSAGADRMTYNVRENRFQFIPRRAPTHRGLGRLVKDPSGSARHGQGVYATAAFGVSETGSYDGGNPAYLDAQRVDTPDGGLRRPGSAGITRVEVAHPDGSLPDYPDTLGFMAVKGTSETINGRRTARIEADISDNARADYLCADFEQLVREDAAGWRLPRLTLDTRRRGGFESDEQRELLLAGFEDAGGTMVFLQRSLFTHDYGQRPVFAVIGATATYADRHWLVEFSTAPVATIVPQHPVAWSELDDRATGNLVRLYGYPHPDGLHPSLSLNDLRFVSAGVGVLTPPADQGWDTYA